MRTSSAFVKSKGNLGVFGFSALLFLDFSSLQAADCNGNLQDDAADIAAGISKDCNRNGFPDECDITPLPIGFSEPKVYPAATLPVENSIDMAIGDFDGDRSRDLAIANGGDYLEDRTGIYLLKIDGLVSVLLNRTAPPRSLDRDHNRVPDECEEKAGDQLPGDANQDGQLDISDPIWLLLYLFGGSGASLPCSNGEGEGPAPGSMALLDFNGDGQLDLSDGVADILYLFVSGSPPHPLGTRCIAIAGCPRNPGCEPR